MRINRSNWSSISTRKRNIQSSDWISYFQPHQLDPHGQVIYRQMITRLQRDMLLWIMGLGIVLAIPFGTIIFREIWVAHTMSPVIFAIHIGRLALMILLVAVFLSYGKVAAAWAALLTVSLSTLLVQIWLLREPALIGFALFSLVGPAIVMPLRINIALIGIMIGTLYLIVRFIFPVYSGAWINGALIFAGLMLSFAFVGAIIRRFVRQFAGTTVEMERAATQRARLEQQMLDLNQRVEQIAWLEHDLRQPLRALQGCLTTLIAETPNADDLIQPAQAAAQRADRLINNLLDLARAEAHAQNLLRQPTDMAHFFRSLQHTAPGLARYYTDPPIPIRFLIDTLPAVAIHPELLERAILNLLDNALVYSPPDGVIEVRAWASPTEIAIEVRDQGPGIPDSVIQALAAAEPLSSRRTPRQGLGLRQVYSAAQAHNGSVEITSTDQGTAIKIRIPYDRIGLWMITRPLPLKT